MREKKLNIVYMIVDQLRFDFLGINGNENIDTPNLDMMGKYGYNFKNAYVSVPSCIAARASIMTGMKPENHKRVGYEDGVDWDYENILAGVFARNGYHTQAIGKLHTYPQRNLLGFHNVILHDGYLHSSRKMDKPFNSQYESSDDYLKWLNNELKREVDLYDSGLSCNSWDARPWELDEYLHPTNWVVSESIDFLRRKDPTKPFFLNMSFVRPHSPLNPPLYYFNEYKDREVNDVFMGDWVEKKHEEYDIDARWGVLKPRYIKRARRAYSALVSHLDNQIRRFLIALEESGELENTIIIFSSDHGDLLGDHNLYRKYLAYEGSSHIPLIIYDPGKNLSDKENFDIDEIVELMDIMPSLLDMCGLEIPETVDGKSFLPLIRDENVKWRKYVHGEHSYGKYSHHFIVSKNFKYIWYSQSGKEQFFDLRDNHREEVNEIDNKKFSEEIKEMRDFLIEELKDRQEGYSDGKKLIVGMKPVDTLD